MIFQGKHILITGGASGIGDALVGTFSRAGASVTVFDRARPVAAAAGVRYCTVDVTNVRALALAMRTIPRIDILINNAGIMRRGTIFEATESDWDTLFAVNLKAQWLVLKAAKHLLSRHAVLVFIASQHGMYLPATPALYALTKAGVIALARLVANTEPKYRVKLVCPGPTDTALHRTGRTHAHLRRERRAGALCTPGKLAEHILRLITTNATTLLYERGTCRYRLTKTFTRP